MTNADLQHWATSFRFRASIGGHYFSHRWHIGVRSLPNLCKYNDDKLVAKACQCFHYLKLAVLDIGPENIIFADQTDIFRRFKKINNGSKHVNILTTGFASIRVTAMIGVRANGTINLFKRQCMLYTIK